MSLVNPKDLILGCTFADIEHLVIANALNAIAKLLIEKGDKEAVFNQILPISLDYLTKHLTHEERVMENAFEYWIEEEGYGDIYEDLKRQFWEYLKSIGKDFSNYEFKDFMTFKTNIENDNPQVKEILRWWQLIENQKHGHKSIAQQLTRELERINPNSPPKKIAQELGMIVSYILSRVLKLDRKYVEFFREKNIPACFEKPLIPDKEVVEILKGILGDEFVFI